MIHVIATIHLHPGRRDDFLAELARLMPKVHAEEGCLEYGPAVDFDSGISVQQFTGDNVVTIIEKWSSLDALKDHLRADHMTAYRQRVHDFVERVTLHLLRPALTRDETE
jgi:quinol monooxygenase YgiN